MREFLTTRLIPVLAAIAVTYLLGPTAVPGALMGPLRQAQAAFAGGRMDVALDALEEALAFEPGFAALHPLAARAALEARLPASALAHLQSAEALLPSDPSWRCQEGLALAMLEDRRGAVDLWGEEAETCFSQPEIVRSWAEIALATGDREETLDALARLTILEPANPEAYLRYGLALATQDPETAVDTLRIADELSAGGSPIARQVIDAIQDALREDDPAYALAAAGQALGEVGEWRLAAWAFLEALLLNPQYTAARAYFGLALDQSGGDGLLELERAVAASPGDPLPHFFLGLHWRAQGDPAAAVDSLMTAAELDPANPSIAAELGGAFEDLGEMTAALAALRHAAELAPREAGFWRLLAQFSLRHEIELRRVGLPAARNAYLLAPEDATACDDLGYGYYLVGDSALASRFLRRALELDPMRPLTQYHFGLLLIQQNEIAEARAAFEIAARLDPQGAIGSLAERTLDGLPSP